MSKNDYPVTTAIRDLRSLKIDFEPYLYDYEEKGGTAQTAKMLGVDEHSVVKTLVMDSDGEVIIILMHGDTEVSTKELARQIGAKKVEPCDQKSAQNATGYQFGGTSPFGTRKKLKVCCESSILELEKIYINGGKRGFIIGIDPSALQKAFSPVKVNVAL